MGSGVFGAGVGEEPKEGEVLWCSACSMSVSGLFTHAKLSVVLTSNYLITLYGVGQCFTFSGVESYWPSMVLSLTSHHRSSPKVPTRVIC